MSRAGDSDGFMLPDGRRELTASEMFWLEVLRDLYAGQVRAPRLVDVQTLRELLWAGPDGG